VRIYVADLDNSRQFYAKLFGVRPNGGACDDKSGRCLHRRLGTKSENRARACSGLRKKNWIAEIAFATDDVEKMRSYLVAHGVSARKSPKYRYDKQIIEAIRSPRS